MAVDTVALTIGLLSAFIVVVALAAQIRYSRYSKRVLKRQQRLKRADKLLDALAGTLRAVANPDATPATGLTPETDTLVRENTRSRDFAARGRRASRTRGVSNPNAPRGHVAPFLKNPNPNARKKQRRFFISRREPARDVRAVARRSADAPSPFRGSATENIQHTHGKMLVFTDIESSTTAAAEAPSAMLLVQETHDRIMRQGIQRFAGYEIHTQGDAFEIAFATAVSATQFCLWTQDQLMNYEWPGEVLHVPQFAAVVDEETDDVIFRGPRVRMGVHAAPPGTWRKGTHGYTHHTVFGGEGVDLIAAVSDAGHGGQVVLTKDAADALIPRIHKVDALLESIGTFRVRADDAEASAGRAGESPGVSLELFDCQPLPTPKRPKRVFSKHLRRIEYIAPGRSLAVIPPPPALRRDSKDEAFIVVVFAEEGTRDDAELADALAAVLAQQAQLAGGYLASSDACAEGGAVVIFRTDYGAAARFLAVLPVVLAWWEWPDGARKHAVVEGAAPVPTVRVKVAMHVSSDVYEETLSAEARAAKLAARKKAREPRDRGKLDGALGVFEHGIERAGSVLRRGGKRVIDAVELTGRGAAGLPARMLGKRSSERSGLRVVSSGGSSTGGTLDHLSEYTEMTEVRGPGLDRARAVAATAYPGQCIMTLSAFTNVQSSARMPAGAFPVSLGRHAITPADLRAYERSNRERSASVDTTKAPETALVVASAGDSRATSAEEPPYAGEELYELVSTFLGMRSSTPRLGTAKALTPGYRQSPDPSRAVAVCFVSLSAPDRDSDVTKRALETASACLRVSLSAHRGYECKQPEPNKFTLAFADFDDAVSFTGDLHVRLLTCDWEDALLRKRGCEPRFDPNTGATVWRGLHARCGVAFGLGSTRKPLNTGRADYFGAIPNLAARVCAVAQYGQTLIEPTEELRRVRWTEKTFGRRADLNAREPSRAFFSRDAEHSHSTPFPAKNRSSVVAELARSPDTPGRARASLNYGRVGALVSDRDPDASSVWSTLETNDESTGEYRCGDEYSLVDANGANGAFEPRRWVDGIATASWDDGLKQKATGDERDGHESAMGIDLLGQFSLRGVSRRVTLAQALPAALRAARSKTFEQPEGLAVAARDAAVGAVSIASRDAHLHYDKNGLGKSTALSFARSRSMTNGGTSSSSSPFVAFRAVLRLLSPRFGGSSENGGTSENGGERHSLRGARVAKPRSVRSVTVAASDVKLDAMEAGLRSPATNDDDGGVTRDDVSFASSDAAPPLTAGLRGLDKFRKAGKLVAMANRFEGAMRARQIRKGLDDWGFAGDLENMPTAESERAAEDAAAARIGSGKGAERLIQGADGAYLSPAASLEKAALPEAPTEPAASEPAA